MDDIAPYLLEEIQKEFDSLYHKNKKIQKLLDIINSGRGTYEEANEYAIEVGEILAKCYADSITEEILPDGKMYYNIAKRTIEPTMKNNFDLISNVSVSAQEALNQKANIGLAVEYPEINQYKIDSIINKLTSDQFDKVAFILQEPVAHFSQSIVDDTIKANAELHSRSGLHPKIIRKVRGGCCKWCMNLAGTYAYPDDVPDDVYRRHDHCRCEVLYDPGEGKQVQNVHTKSWENQEEDIQRRIEFSTSKVSKYAEDVTAEYFGTAKPGEGSISYDDGYDVSSHKHEVQMANFLFEKFGGDLTLLKERNIKDVKTPDYVWNSKYWDLKNVSSEKAAYSAVRHGIKQIIKNPGGLILDYRNTDKNNLQLIINQIDDRMQRTKVENADIMIILENNRIKIYRYKK
jgi:hypothetical protein